MINNYEEWSNTYPEAAQQLNMLLNSVLHTDKQTTGKTETQNQQNLRFKIAKEGAYSFRNNVGATPARCKHCGESQQPVRYGLANDSQNVNKKIKSSDLILAIPRTITSDMIGTTIAQFGSVEVKPSGWFYTGKGREEAQAAWLALVKSIGGFATFSTGDIKL